MASPRALNLKARARWAAPLCLRRPEHARCPEPAEHGEEREIGHAPRRPKEPRGCPRYLGDGVVPLPHLAPGLRGPREPEAPVAPRVVAKIVPRCRDAPDERTRPRRPLADEEEGGLRAVGGQKVEHARSLLGVRPVIEGEGDFAPRPRATPDAPQCQQMRAPGVTGPERRDGREPRGDAHDARSRASFSSPSTRPTMSGAALGRR